MSVTEAKKKFEEAKAAGGNCTKSIQTLQEKVDQLVDSLPQIKEGILDAEKVKTSALDTFALHSNKESESELRRARAGYESAQKTHNETNELVEATNRALMKRQAELTRLNNVYDLARREYWLAVFDEIKSAISSEVFESVRRLQVIGSQCGQTRQFLLETLFPNLSSGEHQEIRSELIKKYGIDE